jgi:hypothetical protein
MAKEYLVAVSTVINATVEANVERAGPGTVTKSFPLFNIMVVESEDEAFASNVMAGVESVMHVAPNVQLSIKLPFDPVPLNLTYDPVAAPAFAASAHSRT